MKQILVVDDDLELRENLAEILHNAGYNTAMAASGTEALERVTTDTFDIVLLDMIMPGLRGLETLTEIKKLHPRTGVIMITAFATIQNAVESIKMGACDYLTKPFKIDELLTTIARVLEETRLRNSSFDNVDIDEALSALANPIRRKILRSIENCTAVRLMELTRELDFDDHTKIVFHLKNLKEASLISQQADKSYNLTAQGELLMNCFRLLERSI